MATEHPSSQQPPAPSGQGGGLLSKMVKFVSNPTKDWKDLESQAPSPSMQTSSVEDDANAQQLRERIERKRRNDFIRKAEFAHLRKIINGRKKQKQPTFSASVLAQLAGAQGVGTETHSPIKPSKSRSGTLEKINEIEAQLSKQWWQAGQGEGGASGDRKQSGSEGAGAEGADASSDLFLEGSSLFFADAVVRQVRQARQVMATQEDPDAKPNEWVARLREMEEVLGFFGFQEEFVHQADLEEAAILFASHRVADAEKGLVEVIRKHANDAPQDQVEIWMTLFDLYRAIGAQDRFDAVAIDFAKRFDRSAPVWVSLPEQLGMAQEEKEQKRPFSWTSPPDVALQTVSTLAALLDRAASPYRLGWARLVNIQLDAVEPLTQFFNRLATQSGVIKMEGIEKLLAFLTTQTVVADASVDARWWRLRLAILQLMNDAEQFELVALDYTITYEESPPAFRAPIAQYGLSGDEGDSALVSTEAVAEAKFTMQTGILQGRIDHDATDALERAVAASPANAPITIDCSKLIAIDFSAAGSVLNWAATQQSQGRVVIFSNLHRLIAIFFNVIGISEHARIVPRKN